MELWDIYDRDKQRTGRTMKRNDWHMQPGDFHLTVLGVIRHTNGKYLITKRVMTKAWAPGWWEVSGGGDNYFVDIYCFTGDFSEADLHLQEAETDGYMLATAEEIEALGAQGKFLHYDSIKQVFS